MDKYIYKNEQFNTSRWSGGMTTETAIFPSKSEYLERDFIWRLSSAQVSAEESSFTKLPDYNRILMVMDGNVVLAHGDDRSVALQQWQQDTFDGAVKTKCFGKMTDYNLMFRKGCIGSLKLMDVGSKAIPVEKGHRSGLPEASYGFYCTGGYVIVSVDEETEMVREGQQLVINFDAGENTDISIMGEGRCIIAEVFYKRQAHVAEDIPEEKATFEDFKTAFKLVHSRNKWKQILNSNKRSDVWYDEALENKLVFLDKSYITFVVWIAGLVILSIPVMFFKVPMIPMVCVMGIWSVIHFLAVAPLIYMIMLPKPIKAHMKNVAELTEYERELYESVDTGNVRVEKLLKKYSNDEDEKRESYRDKIKNLFN